MNIESLDEKNRVLDQKLNVRFVRKDIEDFAKLHWQKGDSSNRWNGRQIKNAFQTAVALADWENLEHEGPNGPILKIDHFEKVAKASKHFDKYLKKTRSSDQDKARQQEQRHDTSEEDEGSDAGPKNNSGAKGGNASKKVPSKGRSTKHESTRTKGKQRAVELSPEEDESDESDSDEKQSGSASDDGSGSNSESLSPPPVKTVKKHKKKASRA